MSGHAIHECGERRRAAPAMTDYRSLPGRSFTSCDTRGDFARILGRPGQRYSERVE